MTDEEAMEALLNSDGYSFPTWTLKLGLPTDEMRIHVPAGSIAQGGYDIS